MDTGNEYPHGLHAPFVDYARFMSYSQGRAFECLYLAEGESGVEDARRFVRDAHEHGTYGNVTFKQGFPRIDPNPSHRAQALHYLAHGRLDVVLKAIDHFGARILELREPAKRSI